MSIAVYHKRLRSYQPSKFKCLDFLRKKEFMFLLWIKTLEPLKLKQSFVPHMKVLTCGINSSGAQLHGCIFILHHPSELDNFCFICKTAVSPYQIAIMQKSGLNYLSFLS